MLDRTRIDHEAGPTVARASIASLFSQLIEDGRGLARAEFALYRAEAGRRVFSAGAAAGLLVGAIALAQAALVALLVGLILVLARPLGIGWAVTVVVLGSLSIVGLLAWLGVRQVSAMIDPDAATRDDPK